MRKSSKSSRKKAAENNEIAFLKLAEYAESLGFTVDAKADESYAMWREQSPGNIPDEIALKKSMDLEKKVYTLLHELAHHEIRSDWKQYKQLYPATVKAEKHYRKSKITKYKRRVAYMAEALREECQAWDMGTELARSLDIDLDIKNYRKYSDKAIASYIRYYGHKLIR